MSMIKLLLVIQLIALALSKPGRHFLIETEDEVNIKVVWLKCKWHLLGLNGRGRGCSECEERLQRRDDPGTRVPGTRQR